MFSSIPSIRRCFGARRLALPAASARGKPIGRAVLFVVIAVMTLRAAAQQGPLVIPFTGAVEPPPAVRSARGGIFAFRFEIYDAPSGGRVLHREDQRVLITRSHFKVFIGQTELIPPALASMPGVLWLQIYVDFDAGGFGPEDRLSPRTYLAPFMQAAAASSSELTVAPIGLPLPPADDTAGPPTAENFRTPAVLPEQGSNPASSRPSSQGDRGPPGPKGEKGDTGEKGAKGVRGETGIAGSTGEAGPAGPSGPKGDRGTAGPQGPAGPSGAQGTMGPPRPALPIPAAPAGLHLERSHGPAASYSMRWNELAETFVAGYALYHGGAPFSEETKLAQRRKFAPEPPVEVAVAAGSGERWFRVAAINFDGLEGPLSSPYRVDPASRIAYIADQRTDEARALYLRGPGGAESLRLAPQVEAARWSPNGTHLAFLSPGTRGASLFTIEVSTGEGGAPAPPSPLARGVTQFQWMTPGDRLAFVVDSGSTNSLNVAWAPGAQGAASSGEIVARLIEGKIGSIAPSADGRLIAMAVDGSRPGGPGIKVLDLEADESRSLLAPAQGGVLQFAWSPAARRVAYRLVVGDGASHDASIGDLFVFDVDEATTPALAKGTLIARGVSAFTWSPEGERLAYGTLDAEGEAGLLIGSPSGPALHRPVQTFQQGSIRRISWSSDGTRLALAVSHRGEGTHLYATDAEGWFLERITPEAQTELYVGLDFRFSPRGNRLAFRADVDTPGATHLFVTGSRGEPYRRVGLLIETFGGVESFAWSPDGARLAYRAGRGAVGLYEIFVTDLASNATRRVNAPLAFLGSVQDYGWSALGMGPDPAGWSAAVTR